MTMTKTITCTICGVEDELAEALIAELADLGLITQVEEDQVPAADDHGLGSAGAFYDPQGDSFWRIENLARDLLIASQERGGLTPDTKTNKLEVLACFWIAANFQTVRNALAHSFGDDPFPVGGDFGEFVKNFLGEEAYDDL